MFCTQCGTQFDEGANFCRSCGARVRRAPEPVSSALAEEVRSTPASTPPIQTAPGARSEESVARPQATVREGRGINKAVIIGAALVLIVGAGVGVYFGTDLFRQTAKQQSVAAEPARIAPRAPAGTVEEPKVAGETSDGNLASTGQLSAPESAPQAPVEVSKSAPPTSSASRRTASPGIYEILRATKVFAEPSGSSRTVATISQGTRVTVVGDNGEWLEVQSKSGNPPGFIRRADATFAEKSN
jgi:zinc-ribbon domain